VYAGRKGKPPQVSPFEWPIYHLSYLDSLVSTHCCTSAVVVVGNHMDAAILFFMTAILLRERTPEQLVVINDKYMRKAAETLQLNHVIVKSARGVIHIASTSQISPHNIEVPKCPIRPW